MIPTRAALAIPAAVLVLSGCGAAATHTPRTTTVSMHLPATAPAIPATALLRPLPVLPAVPTYDVAVVAAGGANEWLEILTPTGRIVARTEIDPTGTAVGAGGAYWTENGAEFELTPAGAIHKLGLVPNNAGGVLIAPDGVSYAYATSVTLSNGDLINHIVVVRPGKAPQLLTDKGAPTQAEDNANGYNWGYSLFSWTSYGIAFARTPQGMCGCGSFDMQMASADSAVIDPVSGGEITLTASDSCPLSDLGPALESVCFGTNLNTGATDEIRIATAGKVTHTFTLSGKNAAGDAMFSADGSQLAYITVPVAQADECGDSDFTATLRVMDIATGQTVSREIGNFAPSAWSGGLIVGTMTSASGDSSWLVSVNTTTLAVTRLTPSGDTAGVIGVM